RAARERSAQVLVTIFVNPLQFGPNEDFDRYPRPLDRDLAICAANGVDVVFAPDRAQMYPDGEPMVRVDPGPLGGILEGASRPGFFHGVLTVVLKLFHLTRPDLAFFGEKDYQQLTLVRRMVRDTDLPIEVVGVANGARLETYVIPGPRGSGVIGINGAAAHLVHPADLVILISYAQMDDATAREYEPKVVHVDADNRIVDLGSDPAAAPPG